MGSVLGMLEQMFDLKINISDGTISTTEADAKKTEYDDWTPLYNIGVSGTADNINTQAADAARRRFNNWQTGGGGTAAWEVDYIIGLNEGTIDTSLAEEKVGMLDD